MGAAFLTEAETVQTMRYSGKAFGKGHEEMVLGDHAMDQKFTERLLGAKLNPR